MTIDKWLEKSVIFLKQSDTPRLDAEVLLCHVLLKDRAWLLAHPDFFTARSLLAQSRPIT